MLKKMFGKNEHVTWNFDYYVLERSTSKEFMLEVKHHLETSQIHDLKVTQDARCVRVVILTKGLVRELIYYYDDGLYSTEAVTRYAIELLVAPDIFNYKNKEVN